MLFEEMMHSEEKEKRDKLAVATAFVLSVLFALAIAVAFTFTGCNAGQDAQGTAGDDAGVEESTGDGGDTEGDARNMTGVDGSRFAVVKTELPENVSHIDLMQVLVDRETGVEYLYVFDKAGYGSGISVTMLCNPDGTPKINPDYAPKNADVNVASVGIVEAHDN